MSTLEHTDSDPLSGLQILSYSLGFPEYFTEEIKKKRQKFELAPVEDRISSVAKGGIVILWTLTLNFSNFQRTLKMNIKNHCQK